VAQNFARLRFSRTEAEAIARLAPPEATWKALDFDASRETVLEPELGHYRIVHFATHSVLNSEHPELSGVVLSLVDRAGHPQNGFLRLYDIYNLRLGADLVVLSACQTALGGEIKGEGLIGLTRGFLYAGAPRVVATLWEIDDRTTAEVMQRFYEGMLVRGERPAAAMRSAQISMWRSSGWAAPYYWAAFTLQGEWR
jgi:CHAT domain-containing protein